MRSRRRRFAERPRAWLSHGGSRTPSTGAGSGTLALLWLPAGVVTQALVRFGAPHAVHLILQRSPHRPCRRARGILTDRRYSCVTRIGGDLGNFFVAAPGRPSEDGRRQRRASRRNLPPEPTRRTPRREPDGRSAPPPVRMAQNLDRSLSSRGNPRASSAISRYRTRKRKNRHASPMLGRHGDQQFHYPHQKWGCVNVWGQIALSYDGSAVASSCTDMVQQVCGRDYRQRGNALLAKEGASGLRSACR